MSTAFTSLATALPNCIKLQLPHSTDSRGSFTKLLHREQFAALGLASDFAEVFSTVSHRNVIRGLHFQTPPHAHAKLVVCLQGRVQDAVVDLRRGSPGFGRHLSLELSAESGNALYIPPGLAHGFCVLSDTATLLYFTTTCHTPENDHGIAWNSAGIDWAVSNPILSERDRQHPALADFASPFHYAATT